MPGIITDTKTFAPPLGIAGVALPITYVRLLHFGNDPNPGTTGQELAKLVTDPSERTISHPTKNPEYNIVLNSSKVFCPYSHWRPDLRQEESYENLQCMTHKQPLQVYSTVKPPLWD